MWYWAIRPKVCGQKSRRWLKFTDEALPGVGKVEATVTSKVVSHAVQRGVKLVDGVKNIIAVAAARARGQIDHRN